MEVANRRQLPGDEWARGRVELGQDLGVLGKEVVFPEDTQPEALAQGVREFVVDESLGETGPPVPVHHGKEGSGLARHGQVVEDNGRFDNGKVVQDPADLAWSDDVAGQSVPQEVVQTIGAEERKGTLQEGINRVVVEV